MIDRLNSALEGRYRIERELGEGGMATVYLAEDLKHQRKVAVKVLRPELAAVVGAERFLAEIQTTANLQHPHILPLFDSGEADSFLFYVMPYVSGESLREKLDREKQLRVEDAVDLTRKVADALDYAHGRGVVHRDVKPANILLSERGEPLVADFGIALAVSQAGGGRITETGLSLGTPHYMSPEQATGDRDVDPRSDVYALGCVLYEMLAGDSPYAAPTAQAVLARILTEDPRPLEEVRRTVPPHVAAVTAKALEKLPADRFEGAGGMRRALQDEGFRYEGRAGSARGRAQRPRPMSGGTPGVPRWARVALVLLVVSLVGAGLSIFSTPPSDTEPRALRSIIDLGDVQMAQSALHKVVIAPDGSGLAVTAPLGDGELGLFYRTAEELEFRLLPGTGGAVVAEFSPDGRWLVYPDIDRGLMKVAVQGGRPSVVVPEREEFEPRIPHWGEDGTIVFWGFEDEDNGLYRVPATGGKVERLLGPPWIPFWPRILPGSRGVLFSDEPTASVAVYDLKSDTVRTLVQDAVAPHYLPTGHLLYVDLSGGLWAAPFDLDRLELSGDAKPVLQGVKRNSTSARVSVSRTGTLVYGEGASGGSADGYGLLTVPLQGEPVALELPPRQNLFGLAWHPDGRRVAFVSRQRAGEPRQLYLYDMELENVPRQLTEEGESWQPIFSPDGSRLVFASQREGTEGSGDLFVLELTADEPPRRLLARPQHQRPTDWPREDLIVIESENPAGDRTGLYLLHLRDDSVQLEPYYVPAADVDLGVVSPDGRYLAYHSDESGRDEVYFRAFPIPGPEVKVSAAEERGVRWSRAPQWSPDGRTLYYRSGDTLYAADLSTDDPPRVLRRRAVVPFPYFDAPELHPSGGFLITAARPDGGVEESDEGRPDRHVVVHDFFGEIQRLFREDGGRR